MSYPCPHCPHYSNCGIPNTTSNKKVMCPTPAHTTVTVASTSNKKLSQTSLRPAGYESKIADLALPGYSLFSFPCSVGEPSVKGRGIAYILRDSLKQHVSSTTSFPVQHPRLEAAQLTFTYNKQLTNFILSITLPPLKRTTLPISCFSINFPTSLNTLKVCPAKHF